MKTILQYLIYIYIFSLPVTSYGQQEAVRHYNMAKELTAAGDHHGALQKLDFAIQTSPGFSEAYALRAKVKLALHQYSAASRDYNKAAELNAEFINSHGRYAPLQALSEDYKGSIYGYNFLNTHSQLRGQNGSISELNKVIEKDSFDTRSYLNRAHLKYLSGDLVGAEKDLDLALKLDSMNTYCYYLWALSRKPQ